MAAVESVARIKGQVRDLAPGILLSFTIATAATFLGEHYGAPTMLFALLIGMAFHFLSQDEKTATGIEFTSKRLLRVGVALLGARVTLDQIFALGIAPILLVVFCIAATIGSGVLLARFFGRGTAFGLLTGGSVAICGASAALAISSVLPKTPRMERDTLFTVIAVTTLSTIAMVVYPLVYAWLGFDNVESGILIGATIHDVAQVVGAGYAVSPETGDVATYVKLLRVAFLPIVVVVIALAPPHSQERSGAVIPVFAVAFAVILVINSFGLLPELLRHGMEETSRWMLVAAISALGMKTSLKAMFDLGPAHIAVVAIETVFLAGLAVAISLSV